MQIQTVLTYDDILTFEKNWQRWKLESSIEIYEDDGDSVGIVQTYKPTGGSTQNLRDTLAC